MANKCIGAPLTPSYFEARSHPEPNTGCWLWEGAATTAGYGTIKRGRMVYAHRASYATSHGPIPDGLLVCHKCDTPACVNPDHLFLGTKGDNARDREAKGRSPRGEERAHARLTPESVRSIRDAYSATPTTMFALAAVHGVSPSAVSKVVLRKTWRHIP